MSRKGNKNRQKKQITIKAETEAAGNVLVKRNTSVPSKQSSARSGHASLAEMLQGRYSPQANAMVQRGCSLCGEQDSQIDEICKNLAICKKCRNSGISSMGEASGLLYIAYGHFRRLFPSVPFRYPNLQISLRSMYDIITANPITGNIHRDVNSTNFLKVIRRESDRFSLEIVKDIPYYFLEELYVQAFARTFVQAKGASGGGSEEMWIMWTKEYLKGVGRERQADLLEAAYAEPQK